MFTRQNIALCASSVAAHIGGNGRYINSLIESSSKMPSLNLDVYAIKYEIKSKRLRKICYLKRNDNINYIPVNGVPLAFLLNFADLSFAFNLMNKIKPKITSYDVIHFNQMQMPKIVDFFLDNHENIVYTLHHPWTFDLKENNDKIFWHSAVKFDKINASKIPKIITVSKDSKRKIIKDYNVIPEKIHVVYNGIDTHKFKSFEDIQKNENQVLFVGDTTNKRKGFNILYNAFKKFVLKEIPGAKLHVVGKKKGLADRNVYYHTFISDEELVKLYNSSMLTAVPSVYEAFSYPCVESMSCGTPVVASSNGGIPEVVGDDKTGLLSGLDEKSLADNIVYLLENQNVTREMGKTGIKRAREYFSLEKMLQETIKVYNR